MYLVSEQTFQDRLALEQGVQLKEAEKEPWTSRPSVSYPPFGHPSRSDVHSDLDEERIHITVQRH